MKIFIIISDFWNGSKPPHELVICYQIVGWLVPRKQTFFIKESLTTSRLYANNFVLFSVAYQHSELKYITVWNPSEMCSERTKEKFETSNFVIKNRHLKKVFSKLSKNIFICLINITFILNVLWIHVKILHLKMFDE